MHWILLELQRQRRGWAALRLVFGWQGVAAIAFVAGLLLAAVFLIHGGFAFALGLFCLLLAVRAHDLGDVDPVGPTEFSTFWDPSSTAQRQREDAFLAEHAAARAQVQFLSQRDQAALGPAHPPCEL